jgi:site-specific DNA-methyltransferase (adenine-specific)
MIEPVIIGNAQLYLGDCIEVMKTLPDCSVDSIVTDPPYHLTQTSRGGHARTNNPEMPHGRHRIGDKGFMGKVWDGGDIAHNVAMWAECLRVLKPGGHLLSFAGSRTYHRMACAIEDAGFDIRDQIMWLYGSGFPKSRNLDGEFQGMGTALKPAHEPICMGRKPFSGTVEANVIAHGTGAINIDTCRIDSPEGVARIVHEKNGVTGFGSSGIGGGSHGGFHNEGRWPANVIHDGSNEIISAFPQSSITGSRSVESRSNVVEKTTWGTVNHESTEYTDSGSVARFFYCAKADRTDRHEGLPDPGPVFAHDSTLRDAENLGASRGGNHHPTVKPTDLMAYLCRLVTPVSGVVLDPFMGSGSTGKACALEEFKFIGIDMTPEYFDIACARIKFAQSIHVQQRMFA